MHSNAPGRWPDALPRSPSSSRRATGATRSTTSSKAAACANSPTTKRSTAGAAPPRSPTHLNSTSGAYASPTTTTSTAPVSATRTTCSPPLSTPSPNAARPRLVTQCWSTKSKTSTCSDRGSAAHSPATARHLVPGRRRPTSPLPRRVHPRRRRHLRHRPRHRAAHQLPQHPPDPRLRPTSLPTAHSPTSTPPPSPAAKKSRYSATASPSATSNAPHRGGLPATTPRPPPRHHHGTRPGDMAILCHTNADVRDLTNALAAHDVALTSLGLERRTRQQHQDRHHQPCQGPRLLRRVPSRPHQPRLAQVNPGRGQPGSPHQSRVRRTYPPT